MTTSCTSARARLSTSDPAEYIDPSYVKRKKEGVQYRTVKPEVRTNEARICLIESCVLFQEQNIKFTMREMFTIYLKIYMVKLNIYMLTCCYLIPIYVVTISIFTYLHDKPLL